MIENQEEKILVGLKENIQKRLKELGKTMKELVIEIDMTEPGLYKMFSNGSMKIKTLIKISEVLQVPIDYFFKTNQSAVNKKYQSLEDETGVYQNTADRIIEKLDIIKEQNQTIINLIKNKT